MTVDQAESELQNAPLAGCKYPAGVHLWLLDGEGNDPGELCPPAFRVNANNSSAGDGCQDEVIGIEIGELRQPIDIVDRVETTTAVRGGRKVSGLARHRPPGPQAHRHVSSRLPRVPAGTHAPQNHRRLAPPFADELNSVDAKTQDRPGLRLVRPDKLRKNIPPDHGINLHITSTSRPALSLADAPPSYHSAKPLKPILPHDRGRFVPNPGRSPLLIWPVGLTAHPPELPTTQKSAQARKERSAGGGHLSCLTRPIDPAIAHRSRVAWKS